MKGKMEAAFKSKSVGQEKDEVSAMESVYNLERGVGYSANPTEAGRYRPPHEERYTAREIYERQGRAAITVIPIMPEYRYLHTCDKCGCHAVSRLLLAGGTTLRFCASCGEGE